MESRRLCPLYSKGPKKVYKPRPYKPKEGAKPPGPDDAQATKARKSSVGPAPAIDLSELAKAVSYANTKDTEVNKQPCLSGDVPDGTQDKTRHPVSSALLNQSQSTDNDARLARPSEGSKLVTAESLGEKGEIKKKKKKKKRKSPEAENTRATTYATPAEGDGQYLTDTPLSKLKKKSPKRIKKAGESMVSGMASAASNLSPVLGQESSSSASAFNEASLAAAVVSADVQSAIAGLTSLAGCIPRKPRDTGEQPSGIPSFMPDCGGRWNQSAGSNSQVTAQVSSPTRPSVATSSQQSLQLQERIRQQEAELLIVQQQHAQQQQQQRRITQPAQQTSPLQAISQLYSTMGSQAQLQRMQDVQSALQAEVQRQRLQQQVQQALEAEMQRQRIPQLYTSMENRAWGQASQSYPNNSNDPLQPNNPRQQQQQPQQPPSYGYPQNGNGNHR